MTNTDMEQNNPYKISGHVVDVLNKRIYDGILTIVNGKITSITESDKVDDQYITPGFIDAHVHIESSMLVPAEFARIAVRHGSVACVSDPHEIANVLGTKGINYLIENGKEVPFKFFFGAPSCVPATPFETSGASLDASDIQDLMKRDDIWFLGEMMNFPGVINNDPEVMKKIQAAHQSNKPIDGHAPAISNEALNKYVSAGITTDHECMTAEEGEEKIKLGMNIIIREGSAAKNFEKLIPLAANYADKLMFCSDDKHPDDLLEGHINQMVKRAINKGYDLMSILQIACINPIKHYQIPVGMLQEGDEADFIILNNLSELEIQATYIKGQKVAENAKELFSTPGNYEKTNYFEATKVTPQDLRVEPVAGKLKVITVEDGELYTNCMLTAPTIKENNVVSDPERDLLKLVVYNRYETVAPSIGFIHNIGLKEGAFASTVAHDSHNIIAVGCSDEDIAKVINLLVKEKGGICTCNGDNEFVLPLPIAGLISDGKAETVAQNYQRANEIVKKLGCTLESPYMVLSFMALLVIPELKLSDKGLFDGVNFRFTSLFE